MLPETESNTDIKATTNFKSEQEMMAFIILVCNGDWDIMTTSVMGIMTWYEEWQFYFEFIWGRTITACPAANRRISYGMNNFYLNIFLIVR